jgi:hypothetical protein
MEEARKKIRTRRTVNRIKGELEAPIRQSPAQILYNDQIYLAINEGIQDRKYECPS